MSSRRIVVVIEKKMVCATLACVVLNVLSANVWARSEDEGGIVGTGHNDTSNGERPQAIERPDLPERVEMPERGGFDFPSASPATDAAGAAPPSDIPTGGASPAGK